MKPNLPFWNFLILILFPALLLSNFPPSNNWIIEKHKGFTFIYTTRDKKAKKEYLQFIHRGLKSVNAFFNQPMSRPFKIVIHPDRHSLDSTWQKDWNMPDFKSECWMVASGVADKLDMISPQAWSAEACEHQYVDNLKTQRLITHELFHVYHGQLNVSPDFSEVDGIDWFVEGLATYASGQCDSTRMNEIRKAILENKIPSSLDKFWTGKLKYGLSGSIVMFIDQKYGRAKLNDLLKFNKKSKVLSALNITEIELIDEWKKYMKSI